MSSLEAAEKGAEVTASQPDLSAGVALESLVDGVPFLGSVGEERVILVRRGDDVCAIGASCSHYGGPLAEGITVDDTIRCPWHHACFDLRTGDALRAPALNPVPTYEIRGRDEVVIVGGKRNTSGPVRATHATALDPNQSRS